MSQTTKNLLLILGLATIAWGGYYLYSMQASDTDVASDEQLQTMLANTSVFIQRRQELDKVDFKLSIFEDKRFNSLRTHSKPLESQTIGRSNPFATGGAGAEETN